MAILFWKLSAVASPKQNKQQYWFQDKSKFLPIVQKDFAVILSKDHDAKSKTIHERSFLRPNCAVSKPLLKKKPNIWEDIQDTSAKHMRGCPTSILINIIENSWQTRRFCGSSMDLSTFWVGKWIVFHSSNPRSSLDLSLHFSIGQTADAKV